MHVYLGFCILITNRVLTLNPKLVYFWLFTTPSYLIVHIMNVGGRENRVMSEQPGWLGGTTGPSLDNGDVKSKTLTHCRRSISSTARLSPLQLLQRAIDVPRA